MRALALLRGNGNASAAVSEILLYGSALIIALGREGSQLGRAGRAIMQDLDERGRHESVTHRCRTCPGPRAARECVGGGL